MPEPAAAPGAYEEFQRLLPDLRTTDRRVYFLERDGRRLAILVDPSLVQAVLVDHARLFTKGGATQYWRGVIGDGTASRPPLRPIEASSAGVTDVTVWRRFLRRSMLHHFSGSRLAAYRSRARAETDRLSATWRIVPNRDLVRDARALAVGTFVACFGSESSRSGLRRANEVIRQAMGAMREAVDSPTACPYDSNRTPGHRVRQVLQILRRPGFTPVLKRANVLDATFRDIAIECRGEDPTSNLFATLASASEKFVDAFPAGRVPGLLQVIFMAGTETVSSALMWLLWHLTNDPDLQERVASADDDRLLRACLYESLRLHPPSWSIPREAVRTIRLGGERIDRGGVLLASPLLQHYQARWYPDPERFDPVRFLDPPPLSGRYYPFGLGLRTCPAMSVALAQVETIAGHVLRSWRLEPLSRVFDLQHWLGLELSVEPGQALPYRATPR